MKTIDIYSAEFKTTVNRIVAKDPITEHMIAGELMINNLFNDTLEEETSSCITERINFNSYFESKAYKNESNIKYHIKKPCLALLRSIASKAIKYGYDTINISDDAKTIEIIDTYRDFNGNKEEADKMTKMMKNIIAKGGNVYCA